MDSCLALRKFVIPEFIFGADARLLVSRYANNLHLKRVLLVSDAGVAKAGWTSEVAQLLETADIKTVTFLGVSPNPRDYEIMEGCRLYEAEHCEGIVAIGGGSAIDAAKGVGIVASNGRHILDYEGVDNIPLPMPPLIAIPTTGGTSADVSQFAIINDVSRRVKIAIISKSALADVALIDPLTLCTMDPLLTAATGMDALTHAIEAYVSNASSAITDEQAKQAIALLWKYLPLCIDNPTDVEARGNVMLASLLAGMAFSNASLGCVHAMAHSLGGYLDLPHGECNALLLPHVMEYNYSLASERYDCVGTLCDQNLQGLNSSERKKKIIAAICDLRRRVGITWTLGNKGLRPDDIAILSRNAIQDACNATNPRSPTANDLATIFHEAL